MTDDDELRELLRRSDPASRLGPADPDRVSHLLEVTMSSDTDVRPDSTETRPRHRNPLTWLVAAAAVLVIAGVGAFGFNAMRSGGTTEQAGPVGASTPAATDAAAGVNELAAPPQVAGKCAVPSAAVLAGAELAFAGTVTAATNGQVTLATTTVYAGEVADQVTVTAPPAELQALIGAVGFEIGGDYLVSTFDGQVSVCGFSGPATPALQTLYEQAFPR